MSVKEYTTKTKAASENVQKFNKMLNCESIHVQFSNLLQDVCVVHNDHAEKLYRHFLFCFEMGFIVFMTILVSMCMLRPEEEDEENGLYDDVGASLRPVKEKNVL